MRSFWSIDLSAGTVRRPPFAALLKERKDAPRAFARGANLLPILEIYY